MQIIAVSLNSVVITPLRFGKDLYVVFTRSCSFSFDKCLLSLRVLQATGGTHWLQDTKKPPGTSADGFQFRTAVKGSRTNDRNPYNCWRSTTTYIALAYPANNARPLRPSTTTRKSLLCVWLRHALFARGDGRITQGVDDPGLACWCREPAKEEENWISTVQAYRRNRRHYSLNPSFFLHLKRRPKDVSCRCVKIYLRL